jgi:hypothetical protein
VISDSGARGFGRPAAHTETVNIEEREKNNAPIKAALKRRIIYLTPI